ncbi:type II toxin-antitoxin system RelE/ParE family toxin [Parapusillimonas sp. JC17]|uniref:type II toxin-antitoxin system RelE/ParE family toxin n=1 Tax=Parapusillimonas sp. JC17 TaxID=3445768 RepID=UPI003FA0DC55
MRLVWTPEALEDRRDIWDYIAQDSEAAAARMDALFSEAASRLIDYPLLGRSGLIAGTRELIVHENYRLVYEADTTGVWILTLVHVARQWPPAQR